MSPDGITFVDNYNKLKVVKHCDLIENLIPSGFDCLF